MGLQRLWNPKKEPENGIIHLAFGVAAVGKLELSNSLGH